MLRYLRGIAIVVVVNIVFQLLGWPWIIILIGAVVLMLIEHTIEIARWVKLALAPTPDP